MNHTKYLSNNDNHHFEQSISKDNAIYNPIIYFTYYQSASGLLSKSYDYSAGQIVKKPSANMVMGSASRVDCTFADFFEILKDLESNEALGYGVFDAKHPTCVKLTIAINADAEINILARTQAFFSYANLPGILMLDHDPCQYSKVVSPSELLNTLTDIIPEFKDCAYVIKPSVSSTVCLNGASPPKTGGYHIYIPVQNAADIPRFGRVLAEKLWLHNHGYIKLSANGSLLTKCTIDSSVFAPERLDFAGRPHIVSPVLEYRTDNLVYNAGKFLDTTILKDLTVTEAQIIATKIDAAKVAIAPESASKRKTWMSKQVQKLIKKGICENIAKANVERLAASDFKNLYPEFTLYFTHLGTVTVREVLANPQKYDQKPLADPVEGVEYGLTTAKFWWNDGNPIINSYAHGGQKYFLCKNDISISSLKNKLADIRSITAKLQGMVANG